MKLVLTICREIWGLFIDDGSLALALVAWCIFSGLVLPRLLPNSPWDAPVLFVGCLVVLLGNVAVSARRSRR